MLLDLCSVVQESGSDDEWEEASVVVYFNVHYPVGSRDSHEVLQCIVRQTRKIFPSSPENEVALF